MNYYDEVESFIKKCEVNKISRKIDEENEKVVTYWHIGRILVEAQGGQTRAKYGNELIKEWSIKLAKKYGRFYSKSNLMRFRQFFIVFPNVAAVRRISWSNIKMLITIESENKRNYYINLCISNNLTSRMLEKEIKNNSYERLVNKPNKIDIITSIPKINLKDNIKSPILIELNNNEKINSEYDLEMHLLAKLKSFFNQLGEGFTLVGNQYKINNYYIDILLFNYKFNCFVVVELKVRELQKEDKAQIEFYMSLVDENIKKEFHSNTLGIIISKKQNQFIAEFVGSNNIFPLTYELI